jgi:stearoyl-CoA desaturase (delta-9 desaturase)
MSKSGYATAEVVELHRQGVNWTTTGWLIFLHAGAIAALFMFSWHNFFAALFLLWMCTGLGISMGYHRLHTHRGYKCPLWLEYFFAICGTLTLEGGPLFWVAVHRLHHQKSDQPGDPHSPREGAFWSHMGWIVMGQGHGNQKVISKYAPDLAKDRFYRLLNTWHWVPTVFLALILLGIGGIPLLLWGGFMRIVVGLHATWLINSATHMFGSRRFATRDDSRNSFLIAQLTFGEGWHNNHHAHPVSVRHGLKWYELDHSWILVNILKFFGLTWDLKVAKLDNALAEREAA